MSLIYLGEFDLPWSVKSTPENAKSRATGTLPHISCLEIATLILLTDVKHGNDS